MKRILLILAVVWAIVVGWWAAQRRELTQLEADLSAVAQRIHDVRHLIALQRERQHTAELAASAPSASGPEAASPAANLQAVTPVSFDAAAVEVLGDMLTPRPIVHAGIWPPQNFRNTVGRDAALRELYGKAFEDSLAPIWAALYERVGWSPEQIEKFKLTQWELEQTKLDATVAVRTQNLNGGAINDAWKGADLVMKAQVRALLGGGDDLYAVYHEFSQNAAVRPMLNQLVGILADSDSPLQGTQADTLSRLLAQSSRRTPGGWAVANNLNWDDLMPKAQTLLTPTQFAVLQAMHASDTARDRIGQIVENEKH